MSAKQKGSLPILKIDVTSRAAIGAALRKKRHELKLTIWELAPRVGISQPQVTRLERGENRFRVDTLRRFARALGVRIVLVVE